MRKIRNGIIAALVVAIVGIVGCGKAPISEETKQEVAQPESSVELIASTQHVASEPKANTLVSSESSSVNEETDEQELVILEKEALFENEKAESFAQELLLEEVNEKAEELKEYGIETYIYDRKVIPQKEGKEYYYFCIRTTSIGEGDPMYIIEDTSNGMQVVWKEFVNSRDKYYIYEDAYIQNVGAGGFSNAEQMFYIDDEIKNIYDYRYSILKYYLLDPYMYDDYEKEKAMYNNLIKDLKNAGLSEQEIDGIEFQKMDIGDESFLQVALRGNDDFKKTVYDVVKASEISKTVNLVSDKVDFIVKCKRELKKQGYDIDEILKKEIVAGYGKEKESLIWKTNDGLRIKSGNAAFDEYINEAVEILPTEELEYTEWVEEGECFRVALQLIEEPEDRYQHNRDYIFVKKKGGIKWIMVDYPGMDDWRRERYVHSACGFMVVYEDVSFDGNKDIVISLGGAGPRGIEISCAYIYKDGDFVYTESFENIPYYSINEREKRIYGWYYDGMLANDVICKYKYKDGEFVLESEEEYSDKKYGDFCFYSSTGKWKIRRKIRDCDVRYNGEVIRLSDLLTSEIVYYSKAYNSTKEDMFLSNEVMYVVVWEMYEEGNQYKHRGKVISEGPKSDTVKYWIEIELNP